MDKYVLEHPDIKKYLKDKHILFDTDAIISLCSYDSQDLLEVFNSISATNCFIDPILLELSSTNNPTEKIKRLELLYKYNFQQLPIDIKTFGFSKKIQDWQIGNRYFTASPTDLYIGATIARYDGGKVVLLTGNAKDFPYPLFKRVGHIILQNESSSKVILMIEIDLSILN